MDTFQSRLNELKRTDLFTEAKALADYKTDALTAKMWIDPNGKAISLSEWHYRWFLKNASRYGIDVSGLPDEEAPVRLYALQHGFFRVNFEHRSASLTIEGCKKWLDRKIKDAIFVVVMDNLNSIDRVKFTLLNDDCTKVLSSKSAEIFSYRSDDDKMQAVDGILGEGIINDSWNRFKIDRIALNTVLAESLFQEEIDEQKRVVHSRRHLHHHLAEGLLSEVDHADYEKVVELINADKWDTDPKSFHMSLNKGIRSAYLTAYTVEELGSIKTFKVPGYDIGFGIKGNGDIVAVHNASGIGKIGALLIKAAVKHGGDHLDHFDGYLTGFYRSLGFKVVNVDTWDDQYAPKDWQFKSIDIDDPKESVYAEEIAVRGAPEMRTMKKRQYLSGRPDVVYRSL